MHNYNISYCHNNVPEKVEYLLKLAILESSEPEKLLKDPEGLRNSGP
jgi:hypothetical protein